MKTTLRFRMLLISASLGIGVALAQTPAFPSRAISLVVPNPPGGLVDTSARLVAEPLARLIGQSVHGGAILKP